MNNVRYGNSNTTLVTHLATVTTDCVCRVATDSSGVVEEHRGQSA